MNSAVTYVTAFLCGDSSKHTYHAYIAQFLQLANTGAPIVLFLDTRTGWVSFPSNVHIIDATLADTWIGQNVPKRVELPAIRSTTDTRECMMIMNAKPEFVLKASQLNPYSTEWFAWIDFGIGHVFKTPETTFSRILTIVPPSFPCMRTAGIWRHIPESIFDAVCWRYAGGFFLIHASLATEFDTVTKASIQRNLPRFAWEVNIWADVERNGFDLGWFQSDHNDSIIPFT